MSRVIDQIEGEFIIEEDDERVKFKAKAAIDTDGSGPLHGDPYAQTNTSLHQDGKPLNADVDLYIVVPPQIRDRVKGVVLGCQALLHNLRNGHSTPAVVGDVGPQRKLGEISVACAKALGINPSPVSGGEDSHVIEYVLYPGQAAEVNGKRYTLQPAHNL